VGVGGGELVISVDTVDRGIGVRLGLISTRKRRLVQIPTSGEAFQRVRDVAELMQANWRLPKADSGSEGTPQRSLFDHNRNSILNAFYPPTPVSAFECSPPMIPQNTRSGDLRPPGRSSRDDLGGGVRVFSPRSIPSGESTQVTTKGPQDFVPSHPLPLPPCARSLHARPRAPSRTRCQPASPRSPASSSGTPPAVAPRTPNRVKF